MPFTVCANMHFGFPGAVFLIIKGKTPEELRLFIVKTLAERRPYYEKARFTITRSETPAEEIVKLINHP